MASNMFSFSLDCPPSSVSVEVFNDAVEAFTQMLKIADASDWKVLDASIASVHLTARPVTDDNEVNESFKTLEDMSELANSGEHDMNSLQNFHPIIKLFSNMIQSAGGNLIIDVCGKKHTFTKTNTEELIKEAERIIARSRRKSFGHIEGKVDKIVLQRTHRGLGVVDLVTKRRVEVKFDSHLDAQVRNMTPGSVVDVKGFILSPDGFPEEIQADDIRLVKEQHHSLVSAKDLEAIFPIRLQEGQDSVSIIRNLRNASGQFEGLNNDC